MPLPVFLEVLLPMSRTRHWYI